MAIDRRDFLRSSFAATALGSLSSAGLAQAGLRGFTHGVASGEPGADQVLLWTRFVSPEFARLTVEVSESEDFTRIVAGGTAEARADRDFTAKIVLGGLRPDRWYFYRFHAPDGAISPIGRTRTLPVDDKDRFTLGVFSCSNKPFGFFNAYAHAAARDDIDLMVHLGDYLYEYPRDHYPASADTIANRIIEPASETIHLADYRARFASYRTDPALQAIHRRFPMIVMWDDHESANDAWRDGADNHDPEKEGAWDVRKAAAIQAYREWMPVSDSLWAEYRIGRLATLFRPEERLSGRTRQLSLATALSGQADPAAALKQFQDDQWMSAERTIFGADQERWLAASLASAARDTRWQVLAQQVNVGILTTPKEAQDWLPANAPARARAYVEAGLAASRLGLPFNMDNWNGYPAARSRLLRAALDADANLIVLAGDSHNAWAFDLVEQGQAAGVEFGGHSVTSPGFETSLRGADPAAVARAFIGASPELRWADTSNRGYMTVTLSPDRAEAEWLFLDTIRSASTAIRSRHRIATMPRRRRLEIA
jgi:alkaline phosphatase D